jgi:hypothetical protein
MLDRGSRTLELKTAGSGTEVASGRFALDVRRELDRILSSDAFHTSERNRRFLA